MIYIIYNVYQQEQEQPKKQKQQYKTKKHKHWTFCTIVRSNKVAKEIKW